MSKRMLIIIFYDIFKYIFQSYILHTSGIAAPHHFVGHATLLWFDQSF